jgi:cytidylate kinase
MRRKIIIAIDGPAGSGKSTTARYVAQHFQVCLYRYGGNVSALSHLLLCVYNVHPDNHDKILISYWKLQVSLLMRNEAGEQRTFVNEEDVTPHIRSKEVSENVSYYSSISRIRESMVEIQRKIGQEGGIVMDGRDIGTVVFPNADLKIFLIASLEQRAKRRIAELTTQSIVMSFDEVVENIRQRDLMDSSRNHSPLCKAADAIEIDTSELTIKEQTEKIIVLAQNIIRRKSL